jgi:hypothetical protein
MDDLKMAEMTLNLVKASKSNICEMDWLKGIIN